MSTTRRAPKRKRIKRRAENEQLRTARRETLLVLLSRVRRGVALTPQESALLFTHVEAEIVEGDRARESERGQQRAMERNRKTIEAADIAIRELEQRAADAEEQLRQYRAVFGTPGEDAVTAVRAAEERAEAAEQAIRELEQRAENFEHRAKVMEQRAEQAEELSRAAHQASNEAEWARAWAEQCAKGAEAGARRIEADMRDTEAMSARQTSYLNAVRDALGAPNWEVLADMAAKLRAERDRLARQAAEADQRLTRIRDMADNWVRRLPATIRTATAAEAVRLAANGDDRPVMFAVTSTEPDAPAIDWRARAVRAETTLSKVLAAKTWLEVHTTLGMFYGMKPEEAGQRARERRTTAERAAEHRAEQAERSARQWQAEAELQARNAADRATDARRYRLAWHSARDRARKHAQQLDETADRATRAITAMGAAVRAAEHRAGRYRLAWLAARRDRRADRAAMAAELPNAEAIARVRALAERWRYTGDRKDTALPELLRALHGPEVITDRATIRDTLAEPEPEPCPDDCPCRYVCLNRTAPARP
ncbi:coiled-coil domain-containing protein [Streptomyces mexicanus]|uniref:hypothetical protein n=1 Tax=Streptomyces mexicanus TaxID=178566 RepID=UPI00365E8B34